jgi:hypothetical protein
MLARHVDDQLQIARAQQSVQQSLSLLVAARSRPEGWQKRVKTLLNLLKRIRESVASEVTHQRRSQIDSASSR